MKEFLIRTSSALVFGTLVLGSILIDKRAFAFVMFVVNILGLWEFFSISGNGRLKPYQITGILAGTWLYLSVSLLSTGMIEIPFSWMLLLLLSNFLLFFVFFIVELSTASANPLQHIATGILGMLYVSLPLAFLNLVYAKAGHSILLALFVLIWVNDSMAYITGRLTGKTPLFSRISPKKTWEGSIGGLLFCLIAAYIFSGFYPELSPLKWLFFALIIVIFATLGDLSESMIKRSLNIKDTGNIMPGHGGILDRFDATLMSAPFIFFYLLLVS